MKIHLKRILSFIMALAITFGLFTGLIPAQEAQAASYTPNRYIKLTTQAGSGNRKITLEKLSDKVGLGKAVTVSGYYKIEYYDCPIGKLGYVYSYLGADTYNDKTADRANTDGWVHFEFNIASTTADSSSWVQFGFAGEANGTIYVADVIVSDSKGVLYSMAADADLAVGAYDGTKQSSIWYMSGLSIAISGVSYEPYMRDVYMPTTGMINPPTVVQNVNTTAKLNALKNASRPQAAWMKVDTDKTVSIGSTKISLYDALNACKGKVIPIFEVSDTATAEYVVKTVNNLTYGVIIASSSTAAIKKAASYKAPHVTFAYITNSTDVKTIARNALGCGAHTCVLSSASRENVEYLQQRFLSVMLKRTDGANDEHCVRGAVDCGANFVVMDGFQKAYDMYSKVTAATYVRRPFVVGHRGMVTNAPENTVEGIREAFNNGADAAEIDIWHTSDKQIVCFHNSTLEGAMTTSTPTKNIPDYTLAELKSYTLKTVGKYAGCKIPTLGEIFTELKKHPGKVLVIEIKTWQAIDDLLQIEIDKYDVADQCVIIAFSENQINLHYEQIPYVGRSQLEITNSLTGTAYDTDIEKAAHAHYQVSDGGAMYSPGYEYSAGAIKYLHAHGITCNLWTATDLTMMKQMAAKGAQFITTDAVASANALRSSLNTMTAQAIFGNAQSNPPATTAKPTTAKPTTAKPTTVKPTTTKATTVAPTTAKPTTAKPTTAKATTVAPTTAKPTTAKPTTVAPTTAKPTTAKPTTAKATTVAPTTARPTTAKPTTVAPTTAKPTTAKPTTVAPTTAKPTTAKPTTVALTTAKPTTEKPTTAAPTTTKQTTNATTKVTTSVTTKATTVATTKATTVPSMIVTTQATSVATTKPATIPTSGSMVTTLAPTVSPTTKITTVVTVAPTTKVTAIVTQVTTVAPTVVPTTPPETAPSYPPVVSTDPTTTQTLIPTTAAATTQASSPVTQTTTPSTTVAQNTDSNSDTFNTMIIIILWVLVAVAAGVCVYLIIVTKKRS